MPTFDTPEPLAVRVEAAAGSVRLVEWRADHEFGIAAAQPDLHRTWSELAGDLFDAGRERFQQGQADRRLQWRAEPIGQCLRLSAGGRGGQVQLVAYSFHVRLQIHGVTVTLF